MTNFEKKISHLSDSFFGSADPEYSQRVQTVVFQMPYTDVQNVRYCRFFVDIGIAHWDVRLGAAGQRVQ